MAVDFARRPYTTDCRFHKDSEQVVKIRWYPALPEAGTLPFPSAISSNDWSSHPWVEGGIGEVFNVPRPYNAATSLPYAKGLDPCEPAQTFLAGEVLDEDADPQLYNEDGFPLCCLNLAAPKGGLEWGGTAGPFPVFDIPQDFFCDFAPSFTLELGKRYRVSCQAPNGLYTKMTPQPLTFPFRLRWVSDEGNGAFINVVSGTCVAQTVEDQVFGGNPLSVVIGPGGLPFTLLLCVNAGGPVTRLIFEVVDP